MEKEEIEKRVFKNVIVIIIPIMVVVQIAICTYLIYIINHSNYVRISVKTEEAYNIATNFLNQWLAVLGMLLTFITIIIPYLGNKFFDKKEKEFEKLKSEMKKEIDEARLDQSINAEASLYVSQGVQKQDKGLYDEAIEFYNKALILNPKDSNAYLNRGITYTNKVEYTKAIDDFTKAIELNPKNSMTYNNRGTAYLKKGEYDNAMADYTKAIELNPNHVESYSNIGCLYLNQNKPDEAIKNFNISIKLNSENFKTYINRGTAYVKKGEYDNAMADYDKAIDLCNKEIDLTPHDPYAKANLKLCKTHKDNLNKPK